MKNPLILLLAKMCLGSTNFVFVLITIVYFIFDDIWEFFAGVQGVIGIFRLDLNQKIMLWTVKNPCYYIL